MLRPGGRLALADIVSASPLKEATRRNTELWAACIAGAIPSVSYLHELEDAGFAVSDRPNDYHRTERSTRAGRDVESVTITAIREGETACS